MTDKPGTLQSWGGEVKHVLGIEQQPPDNLPIQGPYLLLHQQSTFWHMATYVKRMATYLQILVIKPEISLEGIIMLTKSSV